MKCLKCNRIFDPSDEEVAHAKEVGSISGYPDCIETCLPHYCSWDCFKLATHFKSHGKKGRMEKYKEKNRWAYHIGEVPPMLGTQEAKTEEEREVVAQIGKGAEKFISAEAAKQTRKNVIGG